MSAAFEFNVQDGASPALQAFVGGLAKRKGLHRMIAANLAHATREHLQEIARTRHDTARRLGATPSGFMGKAAEKVAQKKNQRADDDAATLIVNHPGLSRAFGDVTIKPGPGKKALTIPLIAKAYNRRAYRVPGLFIPKRPKGSNKLPVLAKPKSRKKDAPLEAWYVLVPKVVQQQDRSLLPSDETYRRAGVAGVRDYVQLLASRKAQRGGAA